MDVLVRQAEISDSKAIHNVHIRSIMELCSQDYTPQEISSWTGRQTLERYKQFIQEGWFYVAEKGSKVVGFGHLGRQPREDGTMEIRALYVSPSHTKMGVGRLLMSAMETKASECGGVGLRVESTLTAAGFYETCGFQRLSRSTCCCTGDGTMLACWIMTKDNTTNK